MDESGIAAWFLDGLSVNWASLLFRWTIAIGLMPHGIQKFCESQNAEKFPSVFGMPSKFAFYLTAFIETVASASMFLGLFTRIFAIAGFCTMSVATRVSMGKYFVSPAIFYALGFFSIMCIGPGHFSLDYLFLG